MSAVTRHRARSPADFGRVAVLYGGDSAEREVSLVSGAAVLKALRSKGVDAQGIDKDRNVIEKLVAGGFERVFIILHGRGGEDGTIQGALETIGIPYTGSGVLGSAMAMDKNACKLVWRATGIPTPEYRVVRSESELFESARALGMPLFVKPVHEGSSIGTTPVRDEEALHSAWFDASRYDNQVLVETLVNGPEYTASILDGEALPLIRLEPAREFYDYEAKYADDAGTNYICPCGLPGDEEDRLKDLSLRAFESVNATGWGRVDLLCDADGSPWFIDVNTAPGMTGHSLVPMAAREAGIEFDELVWRILEETLGR
ncbi:MAG: D-alanine--D-alanine ligase [Gammaproteobacteria bacterium]|nr:D-alanine--D-alanine ligase [Gammaproteobacteria bacterium]